MITDYTSLVDAVKRWALRDNLTVDSYDDFIQMVDTDANSVLRVGHMSARMKENTIAGVSFYDHPANSLGIRNIELEFSGARRPLQYYTPEMLDEKYGGVRASSVPCGYTISGNQYELRPCPNAEYPLRILVYERIPGLTFTAPTNWLINLYPNVYLFGCLHYLACHARDDEGANKWEKQYQAAMGRVMDSDDMDRWSGSTQQVIVS